MLSLGGKRVLLGGFHDHWLRNGTDNPSLLLAALTWYHYDFMCLMDGEGPEAMRFAAQVEAWLPGMRVFPGFERAFGFGHVVTVACDAPRLAPDRTDVEATLHELKARAGFVALAHPEFPVTLDLVLRSGLLHRLLDSGCMDAVEADANSRELEAFIAERNAAGRPIPVVAGWDIHEVLGRPDALPEVLFTAQAPPLAAIDTVGHDRTVVICDGSSLADIREAVAAGHSAVELVAERRLIGPRDTVAFLEANGYWQAVAERDRRRAAVAVELPEGRARVGRPLRLRVNQPGLLTMPGTLDRPLRREVRAGELVELPPVAPVLDRDSTHLPLVLRDRDGFQHAFAMRLDHAVGCDLVPVPAPAGPELEVRPRVAFTGAVAVAVGGRDLGEVAIDGAPVRLPLPLRPPGTGALPYSCAARDGHGIRRTSEGNLTFLAAPRFRGSWDGIPAAAIDRAELCGGYGSNRPYPGPATYSGQWQFAWGDDGLLMRVLITDAVHYNPFQGHYIYQADCLQIGLDPGLRRNQDMGSAWVYNFTRGPAGPELFRWRAARAEVPPGATPPEENVSLGGGLLTAEPWARGMEYRLRLPWDHVAPATPRAGQTIGIFLHLFNNDGNGLLDAMQWPAVAKGMWTIPRTWGHLALVEEVPEWLRPA